MDAAERVRLFYEASSALISEDAAEGVRHYLEHGEHEMALEGLALELIAAKAAPAGIEFSAWEALARELHLDDEPTFDGDFWRKFTEWGQRAR
jgi:hypothetical protein